MLLPEHEFSKPATLTEALEVLGSAKANAKPIAGGTDVVFNMRGRLFEPDVLLSVKDLPELQVVEKLPDGRLSIGAGCRLSDLERNPLVESRPLLHQGIRAVASRHVRNMGTLGGNLNLDTRCWYTNQTAEWRDARGPCLKTGKDFCHAIKSSSVCVALNASDVAPALIVLDAEVVLASADGERTVALADFYTEDGVAHTVRRADELMVRVLVPSTSDRTVYIKEAARKGNDFAYATIAARASVQGEECDSARLVLGSLGTRPLPLPATAAAIVQDGLSDQSIEAALDLVRDELGVLTNLYTPAAYKSRIARALVKESLHRLKG